MFILLWGEVQFECKFPNHNHSGVKFWNFPVLWGWRWIFVLHISMLFTCSVTSRELLLQHQPWRRYCAAHCCLWGPPRQCQSGYSTRRPTLTCTIAGEARWAPIRLSFLWILRCQIMISFASPVIGGSWCRFLRPLEGLWCMISLKFMVQGYIADAVLAYIKLEN